MNIAIIGTGYVGLVTGTCLAELGNQVICADNNPEKIKQLLAGKIPIYEPGLEELVRRNSKAKRLQFTSSLEDAISFAEIIFIAVGTPSKPNGEADLSFVESVARSIARYSKTPKIVVEKSTVPVNTGLRLAQILKTTNGHQTNFEVVSNPEFLREGSAVDDFLHPDRVVIGTDSALAKKKMEELYSPLNCPIIFTDINSAELIKHASNSFLALKISYANAVANICELTGADIEDVTYGMGLDKRIGKQFLSAGIGFGGSCFPKDVDAFIRIAEEKKYDFTLLRDVQAINSYQRRHFVEKIKKKLGSLNGKTIAVLGIAFKPNTDDLRSAPSLDIITELQKLGAKVKAFDPVAMENAKKILKETQFASSEFDAMKGADCVTILTEWTQFKEIDWNAAKQLLKKPLLFDGRNIFKPDQMKKLGFEYIGVGRKNQ